MTDVLVWDVIEGEWRIAHQRTVAYTGENYWVDGNIRDTEELIKDQMPLPIFTKVSHWSPMPPSMAGV